MKKTILIIEDDKELRTNLSILLTEENYNVILAETGEEGVEKVSGNGIDLVICDIMLPGISGYDVLAQFKESDTTNRIPFIFLSAKVEKSDLRLGMELGADDYIFKPFKADNLLNSIQTRLNRFELLKQTNQENISNNRKNYSNEDLLFVDEKNSGKFIRVSEIKYISAENQYSIVHVNQNDEYLFRKSLNAWENGLPENNFLRIHRSTIINLDHVANIEKRVNGRMSILLQDILSPLGVSKKYISKIKARGK